MFSLNHLKRSNAGGPVRSASLLRKLTILLFIISVAIVALMIQKYINTRQHISSAVIKQLTKESVIKLQAFFRPVTTNASVIKKWALSGDINPTKGEELNIRFVPILEQLPQIRSVMFATDSSLEYVLMRDENGWRTRFNRKVKNGSIKGVWQRLDASGKKLEESVEKRPPAPLNEPWLQGAVADLEDEVYWTEPYELYPDSKPGMSAVVAWKQNNRDQVAAVNVLMTGIRQLINSIRIGDSFQMFLYTDTEVFIDFQRIDRRHISAAESSKVNFGAQNGGDTIIAKALTARGKQPVSDEPFNFEYGGARWWGLLQGIEESKKGDGIGILVRESDLIAQQKSEKYLFVPAALAVFWIAYLFFVRIYFRESKDAVEQFNIDRSDGDDIHKIIESGESEILEFKSTLRWNLKTDRAGKEIELASLKTIAAYMNTDGGTLLVGVGDNGEILGIEADGFDNEDKYLRHFSSLFNQHIGLEFSEYVDFAIKEINDKKIFAVTCRNSSQPVFVKHKKEESFYIRSGPSSRQLTTSQVLEYLKDK